MSGPELRPGRLHWIVSYPKSGNTWMRFLLRDYFREAAPHWYSDSEAAWYGDLPGDLVGQALFRPAAMLRMRRLAEDGPAFVKSHHACSEVRGQPLFAPAWCAGAIVVVRDPRDILPSLADHLGKSLEGALELMNNTGGVLHHESGVHHVLGSWSDHVLSWKLTDRVPTIVVRYEDLHSNPEGELQRVVRWLGARPQHRAVRAAVKANQFGNLQALEDAEDGFVEKSPHQERFFRRGVVGGWRDEVPPQLIDELEREHRRAMRILGYRRERRSGQPDVPLEAGTFPRAGSARRPPRHPSNQE